jgi:acyl-CoA synthetase (AMP-forming)/AMP-acid ligase II
MSIYDPLFPGVACLPSTLVELLQCRANLENSRIGYIFLNDGETDEVRITYGELDRQARAIAAWLQSRRAQAERVLLLYPPGLEYLAAYFGCLYAGAVAVPAYPPRLNRPVPRIQGIVADSQARYALTTTEIYTNLEQRFEQTPDLQALNWLDTQQISAGLEEEWVDPGVAPDELAFLQYTSGSTSLPKGVMVSHANLIHNIKQITMGFQILDEAHCDDFTGVSWLPSYHDMGLIGGILTPMFTGNTAVLLSPLAFLQRPVRWLQAISRYNGGVNGGPNFAYDLCVDKIKPEVIDTLDLSCWHVAFCGAEPIRPETLDRFRRTFARCGFDPDAFYPCYGLAEGTLFVSGGDGPGEPVKLSVDRAALEADRIETMAPGEPGAMTLVGCGHPFFGQQILIVDPQERTVCAEGEVGEIWVSGESIAQGYWNRTEETRSTFQATLNPTGEGPFLRTGDLGFQKNKELFINGRLKDLIIIRGSNHYPQDIELTVEMSHQALQTSAGAAFSVQVDDEEQLVVVQEVTRQARNADMTDVLRAIRMSISENHDLQVYSIVLIRPLTIPKTSSGKIQRHASRQAYLTGTLDVVAEWSVRPQAT